MVDEIQNVPDIRRLRFKRVAERRTQRILEDIRKLANCATKINYDYTEDEVNKIFVAIDESVKAAKMRFVSDKKVEFKL